MTLAASNAKAFSHVSVTMPIDLCDPLSVYANSSDFDRFYWDHPARSVAMAGIGAALVLTGTTATDIDAQWRTVLDLIDSRIDPSLLPENSNSPFASSGPVIFGGLPFDNKNVRPASSPWEQFTMSRFVLPRLCVAVRDGHAMATVTVPEGNAKALSHAIDELEALLERRLDLRASSPAKVTAHDSRSDWEQIVSEGVAACRRGSLEKVVLARRVDLHSTQTFHQAIALDRLRSNYPTAHTFAISRGPNTFLGASPEQLVQLSGTSVTADCLAGTAPRGESSEEDGWIGAALLASAKDRDEHEAVVEGVRAALEPFCVSLSPSNKPRLLRLQNVQHLYTPLVGQVHSGVSVLALVDALHPTPAVGGSPRDGAMTFIRDHELLDRGWYASPVGFASASGDGEFMVALRSGVVRGSQAWLYAGCGIIKNSIPANEYHETALKLQPMLSALGG